MDPERPKRVAVVVLGDVGRSPRMQYHALALADSGAFVDLIGSSGSPLCEAVRTHARIRTLLLTEPARTGRHQLPRALFLAYAALRLLRQCAQLWRAIIGLRPRPDMLLVQTPPALPTLAIALVAARLRSVPLIVDWHNLAYSMLALTLGARHPAVRWARWYERQVGRRADAHLCVSRALQHELSTRWGIHATVLYDRPAARFAPTPPAMRGALFTRLRNEVGNYAPDAADRPGLIVSATSWSADEDFSLLLDALVHCDQRLRKADAPRLLFLITGQGPLREHYAEQFTRLALQRIELRTLWLSPDDYPLLLGAADLGLCLHRSASGLDLPMKVADMFGAGLPVCALDYGPTIREAVRNGENGLLFSSGTELASQLCDLFRGFPHDTPLLSQLRSGVADTRTMSWSDGWRSEAQTLFAALDGRPGSDQRRPDSG